MKTTKRFLSIMLIAIMTFCLSSFTVSADYTITVNNSPTISGVSINGKYYTAYKVFSVSNDGEAYNYTIDKTCLCGEGGSYGNEYTTTSISDETTAKKFGEYLYGRFFGPNATDTISNDVTKVTVEASNEKAEITVGSKGYYAVICQENNQMYPSLVMLDTTTLSVEINSKFSAPTLHKYIQHNENVTDNDEAWGKVGDNQIGVEDVNFKLTATIPDLNGYDLSEYIYTIFDTLDAGLDYIKDSVIVKNGNTTINNTGNKYYEVTYNNTSHDLTIDFDIENLVDDEIINQASVKDGSAGDELVITYTAKLNSSAKISDDETKNHNDNIAFLRYSNNPYDTDSKANTPNETVYDYTFPLQIQKVDSKTTTKGLKGAKFTVEDDKSNTLKFTGSKGNYTVDPDNGETQIEVDDNGYLKISGLDDNIYYEITEIVAPDGYALLDKPVKIMLTASYKNDMLDELSQTIDDDSKKVAELGNNGTVLIKNTAGSILVGTGGIGTTIFYISGGILMAGAVILLIVKKRTHK